MTQIRVLISVLFFAFSLPAFSAQVTGVIDNIYGSTIKGWACVTTQTQSIPVHIYVGGQAHVGVRLAVDTASDYSETAVDNACQHSGARARHRFSYTFTEAQKSQYQGQKIYVHGIGSGVPNLLLSRSGTFVMPKPTPKVTGIIDGIYNDSTIKGWACVTTQTQSIPIHIYAGGQAHVGTRVVVGTASDYSETAVDNECQHPGVRARHRFSYTFTEAQKRTYQGQRIYVHGIGSGVSNLLLSRSGSFVMPKPKPVSIGVIEKPETEDLVKGWACIKGQTSAVTVDMFADGKLIRTVTANKQSDAYIDPLGIQNACGHLGIPANHWFSVPLSNQDRMQYGGQKLSARVRETSTWLDGHLQYSISSNVKYLFTVNQSDFKSIYDSVDEVSLEWDYLSTRDCPQVKATVISFPGGPGTTHGTSKDSVHAVEQVLGQGCVRLIRANVNPGRTRPGGAIDEAGYWLHNASYRGAATLMSDIIAKAKSTWVDLTGTHPSQGKTIVAGSSAGSLIAAAALEWLQPDRYHELVDRTIMVSGPLGVDTSLECGLIKNVVIKSWLDRIFQTGTACQDQSCTLSENCPDIPGSDKDVVNINNHNRRDYLPMPTRSNTHEIAILVGSSDPLGCTGLNISGDCGDWDAAGATSRYIKSISGYGSIFQYGGIANPAMPYTKHVIAGGTHDLWDSSEARKIICKNALSEVNMPYTACDSL